MFKELVATCTSNKKSITSAERKRGKACDYNQSKEQREGRAGSYDTTFSASVNMQHGDDRAEQSLDMWGGQIQRLLTAYAVRQTEWARVVATIA